jgi:tetratricopeptide (TPR) repeat protein
LSRQGKRPEAIAALQEALRIFPNYFNARFALGNEFMKAGKHAEAIAELDQARQINPRDDRTYEMFGMVLMQQKKFAVAAAVFAEAARLNGLDPQYPLMRAMALIEQVATTSNAGKQSDVAERNEMLADAERNLNRALDLSRGRLSLVHLQLARVYERQGARARAADQLEQYLKENQNAQNAGAIREGIKKLRANP